MQTLHCKHEFVLIIHPYLQSSLPLSPHERSQPLITAQDLSPPPLFAQGKQVALRLKNCGIRDPHSFPRSEHSSLLARIHVVSGYARSHLNLKKKERRITSVAGRSARREALPLLFRTAFGRATGRWAAEKSIPRARGTGRTVAFESLASRSC